MKKFFTILMILIGLNTSANAQNLTAGVKGGLNTTDINNSGAGPSSTSTKSSFYLGAFLEYKFNRFLGISPELVYSGQGAKSDYFLSIWTPSRSYSMASDGKINLNYINVPILAKFYPVRWLSIDFGPQFGLLVAANAKTTGNYTPETADANASFKTGDVSLAMGLTFNLGQHFLLQGRYNMGLTDISKKVTSGDTILPDNGKKHTNSVIQLGLGVRF